MVPRLSGRLNHSSFKPFPADPVVCFICDLHTCVSLRVLPHLGTHRVKFNGGIVPQGIFSFVFLLLLVVVLIPCVSFPWFVLGTGNNRPGVTVVSATLDVVLNL